MKVTIIVPSLDPDEKLNQVVDGLLAEGFTPVEVHRIAYQNLHDYIVQFL